LSKRCIILLGTLTELRRSFALRFADLLAGGKSLELRALPAEALATRADQETEVEVAHFGQFSVMASDYLACLKRFDVVRRNRGRGEIRTGQWPIRHGSPERCYWSRWLAPLAVAWVLSAHPPLFGGGSREKIPGRLCNIRA